MLTDDQVLELYVERQRHYQGMHAGMTAVALVYEGRAKIDLPDMDKTTLASVPNLLAQGVDQLAGRVAQVVPMAGFTPTRANIRSSVRRARTAGQVVQGWWAAERIKLKMAQRARHLLAFGMTPVTVRWDDYLKRPVREVRNPRETYPNPETINGTYIPGDCLFAFRRSVGWLLDNDYAAQVMVVTNRQRSDLRRDDEMTLLEYVYPGGRDLFLTGQVSSVHNPYIPGMDSPGAARVALLERQLLRDDRYSACVVPTRITLDRPAGMFDKMLGMYYQQAKLMALELIKTEKDIFPDANIQSYPGDVGRWIEGPYDGRTGKVGRIAGGQLIENRPAPDFGGRDAIDRLDRTSRVTAGLPTEFGGESGTNIRTGRRGDAIMSAVIDYTIAEAQDCLAYGLEDEDRLAIALAKMYDGDNARTIYVGVGNNARAVSYVANEVFETSEHRVTYPVSGADQNALIIGMEQRVGSRGMSRFTAMTLDPWVANPEYEHDRIQYEGIEDAVLASLQAKANSGEIPLTAVVQIQKMVLDDDMELGDAIIKVTQQATQTAQQVPDSGSAPSPDQLAAGPTAQALTGSPAIPPPDQGSTNLAGIFGALRGTRPLPQAPVPKPAG